MTLTQNKCKVFLTAVANKGHGCGRSKQRERRERQKKMTNTSLRMAKRQPRGRQTANAPISGGKRQHAVPQHLGIRKGQYSKAKNQDKRYNRWIKVVKTPQNNVPDGSYRNAIRAVRQGKTGRSASPSGPFGTAAGPRRRKEAAAAARQNPVGGAAKRKKQALFVYKSTAPPCAHGPAGCSPPTAGGIILRRAPP